MTELDKVFMVESSTRLTFQVLMDIYKSGFTRIPVYEIDRQNIVGMLFTKDLILIDPDDEVEIAAVISFHGNREGGFVRGVADDTSLDKVFREFKSSYLHLLVAYGEVGADGKPVKRLESTPENGSEHSGGGGRNYYGAGGGGDDDVSVSGKHISDYTSEAYSLSGNRRVITGVITLEDVLEAVIKDEIVDETDNYVDVNNALTSVRGRGPRVADPTNFLTLFEHKIRDQAKLSESETNAIVAFLSLNVAEFKKLARFGGVLRKLIVASSVEEIEEEEGDANSKYLGTPSVDAGDDHGNEGTPKAQRHINFSHQHSHSDTPSRSNSMTRRGSSGQIDFLDDDRHSNDGLGDPIYRKNESSEFFTLILQGKVVVHAGSDDFESELGPWCYIGQKALTTDPFLPDFRACPQGAVRLLRIRRGDYKSAMRAAQVEAMSGSRSVTASRHAAMGDGDGGGGRSSPPPGEGARRHAPGASPLGVAADGVRVDGVDNEDGGDL
jgi:metal transporter CNNM